MRLSCWTSSHVALPAQHLTTDCAVLLSQIQRNPKQYASLTLWSWWQRPVWAQQAHRSFPLCEPYGPFVSHACTSACTPCGTSQPSCRSVSWSPCGPECKRENTSKQFKALSDISIHTGILVCTKLHFTFFSASSFLTRMAFMAA